MNHEIESALQRLSLAIQLQTIAFPDMSEENATPFTDFHALLERLFPLIHKHLLFFILGRTITTNALIRTVKAPTIIQGGHKENVLPTGARALINFRSIENVLWKWN